MDKIIFVNGDIYVLVIDILTFELILKDLESQINTKLPLIHVSQFLYFDEHGFCDFAAALIKLVRKILPAHSQMTIGNKLVATA